MVIFLKASGTDWSTIPVLRLRFSDWPISIHNLACIFHRVLSNPMKFYTVCSVCDAEVLLISDNSLIASPIIKGIFKTACFKD